MEIRKNVAPEFVLGSGALGLVGRYAKNFAARKVLVVSDSGVVAAGWADKAINALSAAGIASALYVGVEPNPRDVNITAGVDVFLEEACDVIVAVGGGSPMDCAKGIGIVATSGESILSFEGVDRVWQPGPPLISIPTTAGTSADVSQFAIVNDVARRVKIAIISKAMVPDAALIDPGVTTTMSAELTATTGIDALVHAIEAYVSTASSPITDLHALKAVNLISGNLRNAIAHPRDMAYRDPMMLGSLLAGLAFSNASLGLVHAMAHSLGGLLDLPHGMCNALLLEHVVDFNHASAPERFARLAAAVGLHLDDLPEAEQKKQFLAALRRLRQEVGLGHGLKKIGVRAEDIPLLARNAFNDPCLATNPTQPTVAEIESIFERALDEPR